MHLNYEGYEVDSRPLDFLEGTDKLIMVLKSESDVRIEALERQLAKARELYAAKFVDKVIDKKYAVETGVLYIKKQMEQYDAELTSSVNDKGGAE